MSGDETQTALRASLQRLAEKADSDLEQRYALRPLPGAKPTIYRRLRKALGRVLRRYGLRKPLPPPEPWLANLKHAAYRDETPVALLIWALGNDRETVRAACKGIGKLLGPSPGFAPILVTDVADFAFYSRLGWLIEFVPTLSADDGYAERKMRYLARRYRDAATLPLAAGLGDRGLQEWLDG